MLSPEEIQRYRRQVALPEFGLAGQERLKSSSVLCVGAGGLGSPAALYLTAAGIGRLTVLDPDEVELSNLHRQVLHDTLGVGLSKVESARAQLKKINPHVELVIEKIRLTAANAAEKIKGHSVVIDGSDNFLTRYALNDACLKAGVPLVSASVYKMEGQLSVFGYQGGPCYRCLFPVAGTAGSCAEVGVLGPVPGVMGLLQALETLKILTGMGEPLSGRLLVFDFLKMRSQEFPIVKDAGCPCSTGEFPQEVEASCGTVAAVTSEELKVWLAETDKKFLLLDVREPEEAAQEKLTGSLLLPLAQLESGVGLSDSMETVVCYCASGVRSQRAAQLLKAQGKKAYTLTGGLKAWKERGYPLQ